MADDNFTLDDVDVIVVLVDTKVVVFSHRNHHQPKNMPSPIRNELSAQSFKNSRIVMVDPDCASRR